MRSKIFGIGLMLGISIGFVGYNAFFSKPRIEASVKAEDLCENPKEVVLRCLKCDEDTVFFTESYICKECRGK